MKIKIVAYGALPCEAATFKVNGKNADKSDFGQQSDWGDFPEDDDCSYNQWACADNYFVPHEDAKPETLAEYGITEAEYREIQRELENTFRVGSCGWCV